MCRPEVSITVLCLGLLLSIAAASTSAQARSPHGSLRAQCHKEAGAYWNPGRRTWRYQGGIGTAQRQRFYDCLDRRTMKRG
jgi:hypothetical protein